MTSRRKSDVEFNVEEDSLCDGITAVALSKEDKERIRAPWTSSLIVKSFGRSLGYMFLSSKIRELGKPSGLIALILDMISFSLSLNVRRILIRSLREVLGSLVNNFSLLGFRNLNSKHLKLRSQVWQCGSDSPSCRLNTMTQ